VRPCLASKSLRVPFFTICINQQELRQRPTSQHPNPHPEGKQQQLSSKWTLALPNRLLKKSQKNMNRAIGLASGSHAWKGSSSARLSDRHQSQVLLQIRDGLHLLFGLSSKLLKNGVHYAGSQQNLPGRYWQGRIGFDRAVERLDQVLHARFHVKVTR